MAADFGSPVAENVNPVGQGLTTLSELMNVKRSQQALQTGQYQQQTAAAQSQQEQQTVSQRQAAAKFFQNYDVASHVGPDGTIDLDQALTNPQLKATGDAYPAIAKSLIDMKNAQLDAKQKLATLDSGVRQNFFQNVGGLSNDPDVKQGNNQGAGKVLDAIDQFGQSGGPDAARVAAVYKPVIQGLVGAGKASKLPEVLSNFQLQALDAGKQREQTYGTPTTVNTGAVIQPGVQAPAAAGGGFTPSGGAIPLPPQQTTNAAQQIVNRDPATGALSLPPQGAAPGGAGRSPQQAPPQNLNPTSADAAASVSTAQAGATNYNTSLASGAAIPQLRNALQNIIKLSDSVTTGPESQQIAKIKAMVGNAIPGAQGWQNSSTAYQEETKFMEQVAQQAWGAAGGTGTNAQLEQQKAANPNNQYNSAAVKGLSQWVLAGLDAKQAHNNALVAWARQPGNSAKDSLQFENQWANVMDPRVFQIEHLSPDGIRKQFPSAAERNEIRSNYQRLKNFQSSIGAQ
jgi:hypothetical protein